ncbi:YhcN/YlaJ family sporulation lipoprotein [Neobacillus sp. PS3-34]|uniref:YhcN/YlaJ family sporulation lipoprotein n=1 Tax=Neobacillus sp. PS3-34 TaxID=3070678 RepID=UPI0027E07061|nr:YhcN/YlaJ family sporulation lipoprotein [Neobacillus sp. PS3-34]WML49388.1 YhcN/YlaJ family sporulation lipoprotein [Neobacillus sp. PS3-34]
MRNFLTVLLAVMVLSSCNTNNTSEKSADPKIVQVKNSYIQNVDRKSGQEISRHLVELATSIPNVHDAAAVVIGRYAIVGIDVNSNIERSQVGSIKYSVAESLRKDPHGAKAVVVADPDITARLREISQDVKNGRPVQGIINELADITGRLMPEVPGDIINPSPKNATEEPKKKLQNKEKKNLERKQEEESKYHK